MIDDDGLGGQDELVQFTWQVREAKARALEDLTSRLSECDTSFVQPTACR